MCLAVPGQIVAWVDEDLHIAKAQVGHARRDVNVGMLAQTDDAVGIGDWVLIHLGFAVSKTNEAEARATRAFLEELGEPYEAVLAELRAGGIE